MRWEKLITTAIFTLMIINQAQAFVTVGATTDCDYDNLFNAYNDADSVIRVTSEQVHTNNFVIEKLQVIEGGFDSCADAENNIRGQNNSRWSGLNALNNTVIEIEGNNIILSTVIIENFDIFDGNNTTFAGAGGIKVTGDSHLILRNSRVFENVGNEGGGIRVRGADAQVSLENSSVYTNSATGFGGGIYCENGARVNMDETSAIQNNDATQRGGGIFGNLDCQLNVLSGDNFADDFIIFGIYDNRASQGGGIYLQGGTDLLLQGNGSHPVNVVANTSSSQNDLGGGGIFITGQGTTVIAQNARINGNQAMLLGGGIVVDDFASFRMSNLASCSYEGFCSSLSNNFNTDMFGEGAAGVITNAATATIGQTHIDGNRSNLGAMFAIREVGYLRLESNLMTNNTGFNAPGTVDLLALSGSAGNGGNLDFFNNTLSNNFAQSMFFVDGQDSQQTLNVFNSIIWDDGNILSSSGDIEAITEFDCSIVHEQQTIEGDGSFLLNNDPRFHNANTGDYRLVDDSPAIDLCDESEFNHGFNDIINSPRGIDILYINDIFGPYDAGAFAAISQSPDVIFRNGF